MAMRSTKSSSTPPSGFRVGVVALGEVQEVGGVIAREDGGFAREPMDGAVAAGARFAFGSAGPVDFCVMCRYSERRNDTGQHFRSRGNVQSRRHLAPGESFGFGRQVVDMGSIEGDLTEPSAEGVDVHPGLQEG